MERAREAFRGWTSGQGGAPRITRATTVDQTTNDDRRHRGGNDLETLYREVERRMVSGDRFSDVEQIIEASDLPESDKSALWLLGWSYVDWRAQRREARAHVTALLRRDGAAPGSRRRPLRLVT